MASSNFVDYVKVICKSGTGGPGSKHLHRDNWTAKGGPDGGNGGRGGHVILRGNKQMWTLLHLKFNRHVFAGHGEGGAKFADSARKGLGLPDEHFFVSEETAGGGFAESGTDGGGVGAATGEGRRGRRPGRSVSFAVGFKAASSSSTAAKTELAHPEPKAEIIWFAAAVATASGNLGHKV